MPGTFTRSSNVPRSVIVTNKLNENINNLEKQISNLKNQEALEEKTRRAFFADYQAKKISAAEFKTKVKELSITELMQKRHNLEAQIRALKIKQGIAHAPQKNILHSESQLGKNISDGGSNTKGVFEVGDDYVARLSNDGWRDHANKLLNYSNRIKSPRTVLIEFPSMRDALKCYNSSEYQEAMKIGKGEFNRHIQIVEGT